jgi:PHD-like zinc-binding domain
VSGVSELLDELSMIGFAEEPTLSSIFESGVFFIHEGCANWCEGVIKDIERGFSGAESAILVALSKRCSYCSHLGATIGCKFEGCAGYFHLPCAAASGCFQVVNSFTTFC